MSDYYAIRNKQTGLFLLNHCNLDDDPYAESGWKTDWVEKDKAFPFHKECDALFCLSFGGLHEVVEVVPYE